MPKIIIIIFSLVVIILIVLLQPFILRKYITERYEPMTIPITNGDLICVVRLDPDFKTSESRMVVTHSAVPPFSLFISFDDTKLKYEAIMLNSLELYDLDMNKVIFKKTLNKTLHFNKSRVKSGHHTARYSYNMLKLPYHCYEVILRIELDMINGGETEIRFKLNRKPEAYFSNPLWEAVSGV